MQSTNSSGTDDRSLHRNGWPLIILSLLLLSILGLRLFYLQVLSWETYLGKSDDKRIKRQIIEAPRGYIYDRNGIVLAENRMSYSITIDPFERKRFDETVPRLARFIGEDPEKLNLTVATITRGTNNPQKLVRDADFRMLSLVEENMLELPGVGSMFDQRRNYPQGPLACHVMGYMGELSSDEYSSLKEQGYYYGQSIGRDGIEKKYEHMLKGINGAKFEERNYMNRVLGTSHEYDPDPPTPGNNVTLTLDTRLQTVVEEAFGDTLLGSLVALNPNTGEILVMASSPRYDPNDFATVMSSEKYHGIITDPDKPMFNRSIQATYPPGSTFKMLTAIAGLENGYTEKSKFKSCNGGYYFGRLYKCWKSGGHGSLDMVGAITNSCNVYFYQLGLKVGLDAWHDTVANFGFGEKTAIDLYWEEAGTCPGQDYYDRMGVAFSPGMILNLAIGQGETLVTVLQLARYTGIIATKGMKTTPHLNMDEYYETGRIEGINEHSYEVTREGMRGVVNRPDGTAKSAKVKGHVISGKTGTAQNPHGADHKIFVGFAPYDHPTIAVACVAENAGDYPSSMAVKISQMLLEEYFRYYPDLDEESETTVAAK